jgi:hypothetical protein
MIFRNVNGRLIVVSRNDCKTEQTYYEKIYNDRLRFIEKFKNVRLNKSHCEDLK